MAFSCSGHYSQIKRDGGNLPPFDAIATQTIRRADHPEPVLHRQDVRKYPPKKVMGVRVADQRSG